MEKVSLRDGPLGPVIEKLAGWAAGPNPAVNTPDANGRVAGFWLGFWHGLITPITFVASLFSDKVHVFEVHNNGKAYVAGFILGMSLLRGGGGRAKPPREK